jgi:CRISPR-associated protein Cmr5
MPGRDDRRPRPEGATQRRPPAGAPAHDGLPAEHRVLLRDQQRALHAYRAVGEVPPGEQPDYKITVNDLGAGILRDGLSAALAALERQKDGRGGRLLEHIAAARVPGLVGATRDDLPGRVRALDVDAYMLATREILQLAAWLKRAAQATFPRA